MFKIFKMFKKKNKKPETCKSLMKAIEYEVPVDDFDAVLHKPTRHVITLDDKTNGGIDVYVELLPPFAGYYLKIGPFQKRGEIDFQTIEKEAEKFERDPFGKAKDMMLAKITS